MTEEQRGSFHLMDDLVAIFRCVYRRLGSVSHRSLRPCLLQELRERVIDLKALARLLYMVCKFCSEQEYHESTLMTLTIQVRQGCETDSPELTRRVSWKSGVSAGYLLGPTKSLDCDSPASHADHSLPASSRRTTKPAKLVPTF